MNRSVRRSDHTPAVSRTQQPTRALSTEYEPAGTPSRLMIVPSR
jgi:hypothetical protein